VATTVGGFVVLDSGHEDAESVVDGPFGFLKDVFGSTSENECA